MGEDRDNAAAPAENCQAARYPRRQAQTSPANTRNMNEKVKKVKMITRNRECPAYSVSRGKQREARTYSDGTSACQHA